MMKLILPSMMIMAMLNNTMIILLTMTMLIMMMTIMPTNQLMMNTTLSMDSVSLIMIMLSVTSTILITMSSQNVNSMAKTIMSIFIILMMMFMSSNMMNFYILFEIVLIPTMILITSQGKQPERLQASIYLIIYTITASLPLLASIIYMKNNPSFFMSFMILSKFNMAMLMLLAFLVKMPMFFLHLWLPKAHVEAPLEGSMILAAVLLKLGGYGIIRFMPLLMHSMYKINPMIISISLIGATATSLNCIRQKDLKSLIAYSSVAHMGFVLFGIFSMNYTGLMGAITMMIAHGMSSSALFLLVNDLYYKYSTRNIMSFKGLISMSPNINFWWFMFMAINMSAPPTINTISEILLMSSLIYWNTKTMTMLFMASLMTATFSMSMYINISHNKNEMMPSTQTQQKIHLSLFTHMIPLILLLTKMELLINNN